MDVDGSIHQILGALAEFEGVRKGRWNKGEWTRKIKTALCTVGSDLGYSVCASGVRNANWGEWLYDVSWLEGNPWLRSVPMVAECEWGDLEGIKANFQKLLVARASLRVMICNGWCLPDIDDTKGEQTAEHLGQWVREFEKNRAGDTYLLIIYEWHERRRRSWRYRLSVNETGGLPILEPL